MIDVISLPAGRARPDRRPSSACLTNEARDHVQGAFDALLSQDVMLSDVVARMRAHGLVGVIFGGWVRDRLVEHMLKRECPSRDIDFVAAGQVPVAAAFPDGAVQNLFGGVGIDGTKIHIDAWDLPNTFLIRRNGLRIEFEQLPSTADYNVNAVVFRPAQFFGVSTLLDGGAGHALAARVLDFMADQIAQPRVQAARAVILAVRLDLTVADTVRTFVGRVGDNAEALSAVERGVADYCPPQFLERAQTLLRSLTHD